MKIHHTPDTLTQASLAELGSPRVDDVLDDLAALVERMGGVIHVLPAEHMPCRGGAAASFRH